MRDEKSFLSNPHVVIEMNPTKSVAYLNLGLMYMRYLEDYRSALECFEKAITHGNFFKAKYFISN